MTTRCSWLSGANVLRYHVWATTTIACLYSRLEIFDFMWFSIALPGKKKKSKLASTKRKNRVVTYLTTRDRQLAYHGVRTDVRDCTEWVWSHTCVQQWLTAARKTRKSTWVERAVRIRTEICARWRVAEKVMITRTHHSRNRRRSYGGPNAFKHQTFVRNKWAGVIVCRRRKVRPVDVSHVTWRAWGGSDCRVSFCVKNIGAPRGLQNIPSCCIFIFNGIRVTFDSKNLIEFVSEETYRFGAFKKKKKKQFPNSGDAEFHLFQSCFAWKKKNNNAMHSQNKKTTRTNKPSVNR